MNASTPPRQIVVVDTETTGLDLDVHVPVEVAWWNLDTDERGCFVPPHQDWLRSADPEALRLNRYSERIAPRPVDARYAQARELYAQLRGNTLAGSNPAFDGAMLEVLFTQMWMYGPEGPVALSAAQTACPWHHRLFDLAAYTAGVLGLDPHELPGLGRVCQLLGMTVSPAQAHDAGADVGATVACFRVLMAKAGAAR